MSEKFNFIKNILEQKEENDKKKNLEESVQETPLPADKSENHAYNLALELLINNIRNGSTVRVMEGNGFDSGRTGIVVATKNGIVTICDNKTQTNFNMKKSALERLVSESDITNKNLSTFFNKIKENVVSKLISSEVDATFATKLVNETKEIVARLSVYMEGNTFDQLGSDEFSSSVVEALMFEYPTLKSGTLVKEEKFYMIKSLSESSSDFKAGDVAKVDIEKVKKSDSMPQYLKLVRKLMKDGDGKVYISKVGNDGFAMIRSNEYDLLGDVKVPVDALSK